MNGYPRRNTGLAANSTCPHTHSHLPVKPPCARMWAPPPVDNKTQQHISPPPASAPPHDLAHTAVKSFHMQSKSPSMTHLRAADAVVAGRKSHVVAGQRRRTPSPKRRS